MADSGRECLDPGSTLALAASAKLNKSLIKDDDDTLSLSADSDPRPKICETCNKKFTPKKSKRGKWHLHCMPCYEKQKIVFKKKRANDVQEKIIKPRSE